MDLNLIRDTQDQLGLSLQDWVQGWPTWSAWGNMLMKDPVPVIGTLGTTFAFVSNGVSELFSFIVAVLTSLYILVKLVKFFKDWMDEERVKDGD